VLLVARAAAASHQIALGEVLGSWQGDDAVQFVELRMLAVGQHQLATAARTELIFDDATGSEEGRRFFTFTRDVARGVQGATVLIGSATLATVAGVMPDFVLPAGMLRPRAGRVCYRVTAPQLPGHGEVIDCVAYGEFTGENGRFGRPTRVTPDNRALQRRTLTFVNVDDWEGALEPTPENNAGETRMLPTLCGDGAISQGEDCDGTLLGGESCASLGFASGRLACRQCHFDTSRCTFCGNNVINGREQCDGDDLKGRSCTSLGFTGGTLDCTAACRISTQNCDPTFFAPGGGPPAPECLAAWRLKNAGGGPGVNRKAPLRQRCRDGDGGCDADLIAGTCTFTLALCLDRTDARVRPCRRASIESITVAKPPVSGGDDPASRLLTAAVALGPSTTAGSTVTFTPPLDESERCTADVTLVVPTRGARPGKLALRVVTVAAGGRPRDIDTLKLVCVP
jgi:hypothetical protein